MCGNAADEVSLVIHLTIKTTSKASFLVWPAQRLINFMRPTYGDSMQLEFHSNTHKARVWNCSWIGSIRTITYWWLGDKAIIACSNVSLPTNAMSSDFFYKDHHIRGTHQIKCGLVYLHCRYKVQRTIPSVLWSTNLYIVS